MVLEIGALIILLVAIILALYAAWGGGANDVANAMGTSVGSGALTFRQAVMVAAVFEFAGAVLVGSKVTETVRKGIVDPAAFAGDPHAFMAGMLAAMGAAAIWLTIATFWSMPVSTTHSIVGAIVGFGIVARGWGAIEWESVQGIVMGWLISPILGALIAFLLFNVIKLTVLDKDRPVAALRRTGPIWIGVTVFVLVMATLFKGLKHLSLDFEFYEAASLTLVIAVLFALLSVPLFRRYKVGPETTDADQYKAVERLFVILQIVTAASVAFAHGANDVANAVGPLAAIWAVLDTGSAVVASGYVMPLWIFILGGAGIVVGLATYGARVIQTIGTKITEVTPSRGFSAEISASAVILFASHLGLPVSTTHTLVGAVIGVGLARGIPAIDLRIIGKIMVSWALTLPAAAGTAAVLYFIFLPFFG